MHHSPFQIDLRNLPPEGKNLAGSLVPAFFELSEKDEAQSTGPLEYELNVVRDGKDVIVSGHLYAPFQLTCGRCLQPFKYQVKLDPYETEIPIEEATSETIDLTEPVREDILLALPSYPRCEDGNVDLRECPAQGKFEPAADESAPGGSAEAQADVWNVLDQLKNR